MAGVIVFEVPLSVAAVKQSLGILPPIIAEVILPPPSRFMETVPGDAAVLVDRHVSPKGSLILNFTLTILVPIEFMLGSAPLKPT
jgi:hypothetical protein